MSTSLARQQRSFINRVFAALAVMSVVGMVVLTVTAIAGFEEPNTTLLLTSLVLVFAAPVAMLVHLTGTRELTGSEKRIGSENSQVLARRVPSPRTSPAMTGARRP